MSIEVYYFSAPWCQPCKSFKPIVLAAVVEAGYEWLEVDVDEFPEMAANEGIMTLPTVKFIHRPDPFKAGEDEWVVLGASQKQLKEALDKAKEFMV